MKNNTKLYFDIWRKANFRPLLRAYVKAYVNYDSANIASGFGDMLDVYVPGGRSKYDGSANSWGTAYTISRELAIYIENNSLTTFELSSIAQDFHKSVITSSEYLANYLLNLNQLVNGQVIHPLFEVLRLFGNSPDNISKTSLLSTPSFNLQITTPANARQIINILCNRMNEADIIHSAMGSDLLSLGRYSLDKLLNACVLWRGTKQEFEDMNYNGYVEMISNKNPLIYS